MPRKAQHLRRELTPEEKLRVQETRRWAQEHGPEIRQLAEIHRDHPSDSIASLEDALALLKAERLRQQLSLSDVQERTGIERPNLSRLENEAEANPTIATLIRYAEALGKRLMIVLDDIPSRKSAAPS
jgi:DNA-binding phage protein